MPFDGFEPAKREAFAEHDLWGSVMFQAMKDLLTPDPIIPTMERGTTAKQRREIKAGLADALEKEALDWFLSDRFAPGSFDWICAHIGADAERIRFGVFLHYHTRDK